MLHEAPKESDKICASRIDTQPVLTYRILQIPGMRCAARDAGVQRLDNRDESEGQRRMASIEESVEVEVPIGTAYNQWTQFEEFPQFMEGIEEVRQLGDAQLHWRADIAGVTREWDAKITEQSPEERIAWTSTSGSKNAGVVTFHRIDDNKTKVMLQLDFDPEGFVETAGDALGFVNRRTKGDLDRFKAFIESRGTETGAWRGEVPRT